MSEVRNSTMYNSIQSAIKFGKFRNIMIIVTLFLSAIVAISVTMLMMKPATTKTKTNPEITAEVTETALNRIIPLTVKATGGSRATCFTLTFDGEGAGLSDKYNFIDEKITVTDIYEKDIVINREIGGDGAVNYYFNLENGQQTEFELACTSGVYVTTDFEREQYLSLTSTDDEAIRSAEIEEMIKVENEAKTEEMTEASLNVVSGCGADLTSAKLNTVSSETLTLTWSQENDYNVPLLRASSLDSVVVKDSLSDTVDYIITEDPVLGDYTIRITGTGAMPDFASGKQPWYIYRTKIKHVIIEDGITTIGEEAFSCISTITSISLGEDVEIISARAFYTVIVQKVTFPSSVRTVESFAFGRLNGGIELNEGLETLNGTAVWRTTGNLHLPSTLKSYAAGNYPTGASSYTVAEGNTTFFEIDGVLYKNLSNGSVALVHYPCNKEGKEYTVPSFVTEINSCALISNPYLEKITISSSVQKGGYYFVRECTNLRELIIEEGALLPNEVGAAGIIGCPLLKTVVLPDSARSGILFHYNNCPSLEYIYVPSGIESIHSSTFSEYTLGLKTLYFNASDISKFGAQTEVSRKYELIIGEKVDYLRGTEPVVSSVYKNGFQSLMINAQNIKFVGENQITISEGVFADQQAPLNNLVGTVWVDSQGIVYKYDSESLTASVAYVPYDIKEAVIPATITPEEGITCTVNTIDSYAFKLAENLETLSFENQEVIETIGVYGISYCNKLSSVNGATTIEEATESFTNENISIGYRTFYYTALGSISGESVDYSDVDGLKSLTISTENFQPLNVYVYDENGTLWTDEDNIGKYVALTGTTVSVNMAMNNSDVETETIYRVYFERSELDGIIGISPGETKVVNGTEMTCYATQAPNILYIEFTPNVGTTVNTVIEAVYSSPTSAGGSLRVWGMALTPGQSEEYKEQIIECSEVTNPDGTTAYMNALHIQWKTVADDFKATKSLSGSATLNIKGDGNGNYKPSSNLAYKITYARESSETSSYGKDYVKSAEFYDYLDFGGNDSGISWNEKVVEDIKNGNTRFSSNILYAGDTAIVQFSNSGATIQNVSASYDEQKGVVIYWRIINSSAAAEISTTTTTMTIQANAISVDPSLLDDTVGTTYTFTNNVETITNYTYSESQSTSSSIERYLKLTAGSIGMSKSASDGKTITTALYFGDDFTYTISVYNTGSMPFYGVEGDVYTIKENMSQYTYITPDNIEKMFADKYGKTLTIRISDAVIYPRESVTSQDNQTAYITGANSDVDSSSETLTLSWNDEENAIELLREDGTVIIIDTTLQEVFDSLGYSVGFNTDFALEWIVNKDADLKLLGGQYEYFYIYANNKDTFMMLDNDYRIHYPTESTITNTSTSYLYRSGATQHVLSRGSNTYMKREAYIYKSGKLNTSTDILENDFSIRLDDVIDYTVKFQHYGAGEYNNMPLVDDIYGTQVLLVPVEQNPQLADLGLGTVTAIENEQEVQFYKLSKSGIYDNVVVGLNENGEYMTADTISVTAVGEETEITVDGEVYTYSGLQTSITWYFSELEGESYYFAVNYHTYIDSEQLHSSIISAGNIVWMNDKTNDRIYDSLWGSGSLLNFEKSIIVQNEDGSTSVDADDHTVVAGGESVTYRLRLINPNSYAYTIRGSYFYDELPTNEDLFAWEKDVNVALSYEESENVNITNLDNWYIDDKMYGVYQNGKYYMKWTDETVIELKSGAVFDMYVTLTFPQNTPSSNIWSQYYQSVGGYKINNTFNVYGSADTVYHTLKEKGRVALQKGVYATYRYVTEYSRNTFTNTARRIYYNNEDATGRAISYYTVLYNDGYSKLYINDIYDQLPKGFEFMSLMNTTKPTTTNYNVLATPTTNLYADVADSDGEGITYLSAIIEATQVDDILTFEVSSLTGGSLGNYDVEEDKFYLNHGEAIVFSYVCDIGETAETEDIATNSIGMEYYDYLDSGVQASDSDAVAINGKLTEIYDEQNDGDRSVENGSEVKGIYSFAKDTSNESQWLISDVSVMRGGIIPGVTNYTDSYVNVGTDLVIPYSTSVSPFATINWRSRLHNSGTYSITDYTFVDVLPAPYGLTGTVAVDIYDSTSDKPIMSYNILTVLDRADEYIMVKGGYGANEYQIPLDGTSVSIPVTSTVNVDVSVLRDENGQETLTINFADKIFSIPENEGYVDVTLSTKNDTNVYENTVYTNFGYLIPNVQEYDSVAQGSLVYDGNAVYGIVNSSPANVSIGYSTTSLKSVAEIVNSENKTTSASQKNYILLENKQSEFKYTLTVTNDTNNGMTKLILIDSLPQIGDHSPFDAEALRNSEYKVSLSENPEFTLTVYPIEGESYVVSSDYYTIGYKETQQFTTDDWDGTLVWDEWTEGTENVRSIRLYVDDSTGEQLPAGARIEFSFNAKVDDEAATAGMTAWNSFGYHYGLVGVPYELEAMPLSVGVKIPEVPTLQKQLIDLKGDSYTAQEETTFSFLIYEGEAITSTYNSLAELKALLDAETRSYTETELTVKAGESASEKVKLILDNWEWHKESSYTIVETTESDDYTLANWNNRLEKSITFQYDPDISATLTCTNTYKRWSFEILKTDGYNDNKPLSGAIFALYSPNAEDLITDEEYNKLTVKLDKTIVDENGTQWYLYQLSTTDENGICSFENLNQTNYYLTEAKSPDGYKLEFEPRLVTNKAMSSKITVENYSMAKLPYTGATQNPSAIIGGILLAVSLFAVIFIFRKRKYLNTP